MGISCDCQPLPPSDLGVQAPCPLLPWDPRFSTPNPFSPWDAGGPASRFLREPDISAHSPPSPRPHFSSLGTLSLCFSIQEMGWLWRLGPEHPSSGQPPHLFSCSSCSPRRQIASCWFSRTPLLTLPPPPLPASSPFTALSRCPPNASSPRVSLVTVAFSAVGLGEREGRSSGVNVYRPPALLFIFFLLPNTPPLPWRNGTVPTQV